MISALTNSLRLMRAGYVFAREGVFRQVDPSLLPVPARIGLRAAKLIERPGKDGQAGRLATALTQLGPTYVKLGQFLATRPDVVGAGIARELESLQDRMPPFPQAEAVAIVEQAFGQPIETTYATFGPSVAAASIAQVHRAEIKTADGLRPVAVKVLRPGIQRRFADRPGCLRLRCAQCRRILRRSAQAPAGRDGVERCAARSRWRWIFGSRPLHCPKWRRTPRAILDFVSRRSTGIARPRTCSHSNGSTARICRTMPRSKQKVST